MVFEGLYPEKVWAYFEEICQIPRPSDREEKIGKYLLEFANEKGLQAKQDKIGNVLITKEATPGMEKAPVVVLQSHMDMVCEKNNDTIHDFDKDPIQPYIEDGWVKAKGTTLGADDGIGMAAQLALLDSDNIPHGKLECLFTVAEETGLTGAFELQPGFFEGKILLNLDSEDEGEIFIGCAGGIDTVIEFPYLLEEITENMFAVKIVVKGLQGGHSGDDINKGRGNAIKILNRFLWEINNKYGIQLVSIEGGNLRNALAREATAEIFIPVEYKEQVRVDFNLYQAEMEEVFNLTEPSLAMDLDSISIPAKAMSVDFTSKLLNALYACPHGVFTMSQRMPGMVETSTNLASIKIKEDKIVIATSQRSDINSEKLNISQMVEAVFKLAGGNVKRGEGYPGWAPNPASKILKIAVDSYKALFGKEPIVRSVHAGLECGLFLEKYPGMDMISFGPTLRKVHSPDESLEIKTVEMWWKHLVDILKRVKDLEN
ncbi:MAG: aminoacyl-histidine dipeptidase [Odoribacter sp.]|nr:aminoacyl-histidine dipeptidase [Odoribacter sp.]